MRYREEVGDQVRLAERFGPFKAGQVHEVAEVGYDWYRLRGRHRLLVPVRHCNRFVEPRRYG